MTIPAGRGPDPPEPLEVLSVSALLLLERHPHEAAFVWSLIHDVMREDVWLWHEDNHQHAFGLLSYVRFRVILLDATFAPRLSLRTLIRRVQGLAPATPLVLRIPQELAVPALDPHKYGVAGVVPKGLGGPTERAIRRLLNLG